MPALADAGGRGLAAAVDRVAVPQGSWTYPDPARLVAQRIGASAATTHLVELGIPQQSLINDALAAILSGASDVAVVVGGEAKRWARDREKAGLPRRDGAARCGSRCAAPAARVRSSSRSRWPTGCGIPSSSTP